MVLKHTGIVTLVPFAQKPIELKLCMQSVDTVVSVYNSTKNYFC